VPCRGVRETYRELRKESPMARIFVLATAVLLVAFAPAHAQTGNAASAPGSPGSIAGPSNATPGAASSRNQIDPALSLRGMPCSVSLNATGGVTTSSSCGTDPLEVPARTLASPDQASVTAAPPAQTSAGGSQTSGQGTTSATTQRGGSNQATSSATSSASAGGGAPSSTSTLCSSTMPSTTGPSSAGSLFGVGC